MEELKMILELASKVSDGAQTLLIIYFIKGFLTNILVSGTILGIVFGIIKVVFKMSGYYDYITAIMKECNVYSPSPDNSSDKLKTLNFIKYQKEKK